MVGGRGWGPCAVKGKSPPAPAPGPHRPGRRPVGRPLPAQPCRPVRAAPCPTSAAPPLPRTPAQQRCDWGGARAAFVCSMFVPHRVLRPLAAAAAALVLIGVLSETFRCA